MKRCDNIAGGANDASAAASQSALQLLRLSSQFAPYLHADAHVQLPCALQHGPVLLLQAAFENADAPHTSTQLLDDTLVLLTYGVNYLQTRGDCTHMLQRFNHVRTQRAVDRAQLHAHALRIQSQLRCQRFCTHRLAPLELATNESLLPEVQDAMRLGSPTLRDVATAAVAVDCAVLQTQIDAYARELQARVAVRRRDADVERQRLQRAHVKREGQKKKQLYQKRRRFENVCRRWNYFTSRLLRLHRDENEHAIQSRVIARRQSILALQAASSVRRINTNDASLSTYAPSSSSLLKHARTRNLIRQFVATAVARGLSRVLCASNMRIVSASDSAVDSSAISSGVLAHKSPHDTHKRVLRIGILLCDVHFGATYMGLYQRFLERTVRDMNNNNNTNSNAPIAIEWQLFDCVQSQFPSRATQRVMHAFLIAGGPTSGANKHAVQAGDKTSTACSGDNSALHDEPTRATGAWRKRLQRVVRQIYIDKHAKLGGLGLGHVVLAEALGGKSDCDEWDDGWTVLDPTLFDAAVLTAATRATAAHAQQSHAKPTYVGIKYLHGAYVRSMDLAPRTLHVWRSLDQRFVTCFYDKTVLSFDGFPECGTFVFETMSELYDRDKQQQQARGGFGVSDASTPGSVIRMPVRRVGVVDTRLTLDEKKRLLDVADISPVVAHALIDHFLTAVEAPSPATTKAAAAFEVTVVVNPPQCVDIESSIRAVAAAIVQSNDDIQTIALRVRRTLDGHLVVLGAQLEALVHRHERTVNERHHRPVSSSMATPTSTSNSSSTDKLRKSMRQTDDNASLSLLLSLHTLRDQRLVLLEDAPTAAVGYASPPASLSPSSAQRSSDRVDGASSCTTNYKSPRHQRPAQNAATLLPALHTNSSVGIHATAANDATISTSPRSRTCIAKRLRSAAAGVLTLSETLTMFHTELAAASNNSNSNNNNRKRTTQQLPRVLLEVVDCCNSNSNGATRSKQLPLLVLQLVAALRVSDVSDDRVCLLSRQLRVLAFVRSHQPLWTLVKDCRLLAALPSHNYVQLYARHVDALLFDQALLLRHTTNEVDALVQQTRYYGLELLVARVDGDSDADSSNGKLTASLVGSSDSVSSNSKKSASDTQRRSKRVTSHALLRQSTCNGGGIAAKAAADNARVVAHYDDVNALLLLARVGIDGVVTATPDVVADALQQLRTKQPIVLHVEQLFQAWQARGSGQPLRRHHASTSSSTCSHSSAHARDVDTLDGEHEDRISSNSDVTILDERAIAREMARQFAEHGVRRPPSVSYVPLRPLQPKRGEQVLGAAMHTHYSGADNDTDVQSQVRSIGTFRDAYHRSNNQAVQLPPALLEGTMMQLQSPRLLVASKPSETANSEDATVDSPRVLSRPAKSTPRRVARSKPTLAAAMAATSSPRTKRAFVTLSDHHR